MISRKLEKRPNWLACMLSVIMLVSVIAPAAPAAANEEEQRLGTLMDERTWMIGPGASYTWKQLEVERGPERLHMIQFDPAQSSLSLKAAKTNGKLYGMQQLSAMAQEVDAQGSRVIAGINGDFYDMSSGVPTGLFMSEGELLNSPPSGWNAFGMKSDGSTLYGPSPSLIRTVEIGGQEHTLTAVNRSRGTDALVLYTDSFHSSTMTNDLGDEYVLDVVSGDFKSGEDITFRVSTLFKEKGSSPIREGQAVLSVSGSQRSKLSSLSQGDQVTVSLQLDPAWQDVTTAIGGNAMLVKDGVVQPLTDPAVHPRSAIGTKADGTVIMLVVDGRQPGFSEGVTLAEMGQLMKDAGAVQALNLDGGGSATMVARLPGEAARKVMNSPSDGGERKTANGLLLVNTGEEGQANQLVVEPNLERVLIGSTASFKALAVDSQLHPASLPGAVSWSVEPGLGSINDQGVFTAGTQPGAGSVTAASDGLGGSAHIEVVNRLSELRFSDAVMSFEPGAVQRLNVNALLDGKSVKADYSQLEWRVEGNGGTVSGDGVFTAVHETEVSGTIIVSYQGVEAFMDVNIGLPPVILEDFENGLDRYKESSGAAANLSKVSIEQDEDLVRFGSSSLKLEYDFTGRTGTSGAYLDVKTVADRISIPGYPKKISMWVYGDGKKHWLRAQIRDANGTIPLNFVEQEPGLTFTGWKYLEAEVPPNRTLPLVMDMPVRYMETSTAKKDAGVIYVDQIRALYGPNQDDIEPPVIKNMAPAEHSVVNNNQPRISFVGEDAGYDPAKHPATTLIDPNKIRMYVDGHPVEPALYPPTGEIHYTPPTPLADGIHQVRAVVRDLSGNQTDETWTFMVNTGGSRLQYTAPEKVYAGNTYTLDIQGIHASNITRASMEFSYNPNVLEDVSLIRGAKLQESQLQAQMDPVTGHVRLDMQDLLASGIQDDDLIAQLQYRVKANTEADKHSFDFMSGSISFLSAGEAVFSIFGLPVISSINHHLKLSWDVNGQVEGYETVLQVEDENGSLVEGAVVTADGAVIGTSDAAGEVRTNTLTAQVKKHTLQASKDVWYSPLTAFSVSRLAGSPTPYNINVSMGTDPTSSRGFTWHTHPGVQTTVVELAPKEGFSGFDQPEVKRVSGSHELYQTQDVGAVRVHKALVEELVPGTEYVYRVGDGTGHYGPQGSFRTAAAEGDATKFLVFADSQGSTAADYKLWGNTVSIAAAEHPDSEFMIQVGDMVDKGYLGQEWSHWFKEAQEAFLNTTLVTAVGNHEVTDTEWNGHFQAHFNQPDNGLPGLEGTSFSFDYKNIHFIMLNSEYDYEKQAQWLEQDLAASTKDWNIAIFHRGPYGSIYDTAVIRDSWAPILEKHGVDLVLNGHEHIYLRTFPMKDKQKASDGLGTTYVISGSTGSKFYALTAQDWQMVTDAEKTQMYSAVEIVGDQLSMVTKTVGGRVVDEFTLLKREELLPERVQIAEGDISLAVGEHRQLRVEVKPEGAADKSVTWSVYSPEPQDSPVTINQDGRLTATGLGTAVIRAASNAAPQVYDDIVVTVDRQPEGVMEAISLRGAAALKVGERDQTVIEAVYTDGARYDLMEGVIYASSEPSVAAISESGEVQGLHEGTTVISATYEGFSDHYALNVTQAVNPDPGNGGSPGNGGGSNPGNGDGSVDPVPPQPPITPQPPSVTGQLVLTEAELNAMISDGEPLLVNLKEELRQLRLPSNAGKLLKDEAFTIVADNMKISLPGKVLQEVSDLGSRNHPGSGFIQLNVESPSSSASERLLSQASGRSGAVLQSAGGMFSFTLEHVSEEGTVTKLTSFSEPLSLTLPVMAASHPSLTHVYHVGEDGTLQYTGGTISGDQITAQVMHFSTYAVLTYTKNYGDVPASHWSYDVIRELSSRQLIEGTGGGMFKPSQEVTRAEFTAMLVRALKLESAQAASFRDVAPEQWYAAAVSAAKQAGIVEGTGQSQFRPDEHIQRQEMAAMLVRAYAYTAARSAAERKAIPFQDTQQLPIWAREAIREAYDLNLMKGSSMNTFKPQAPATRAESAQVIHNLLGKLAK
ncbi:phosphodiester glycosidase family protein [Paenibacillus sp. JSM ZJ436]|uniref:phosphodiester glycosidase family protein n=1 Tax=Paenibacillus sp. JSM ZJ436 TaxID=3376190 RepID=UPI0037B4053D